MQDKKHPFPILLLIALLLVDVLVMVCYKEAEQHTLPKGLQFYWQLLTQPWLWGGLLFSVLQLWLWTQILAKANLSLAYPIASLSYPLTMLAAQFFLGESLNNMVWLGGLFITLGVSIIGATHKTEPTEVVRPQWES